MTPTVIKNDTANRFEIALPDGPAVLNYLRTGNQLRLIHTEVPESAREHGYAGQLVRYALDDARREGLRVVPICPYVRAYVTRHPEYADLVDAEST